MRKLQLAAVALSLVALATVNLYAQQQHPSETRGFNSRNAFANYDIDHINLFNGNLTLTVPIGGKYPVGGQLSYSLSAVYNSNVWSKAEVCEDQGVGFESRWFTVLGIWGRLNGNSIYYNSSENYTGYRDSDSPAPGTGRGSDSGCWPYTFPNPAANAGLGWSLSLGKVYPPQLPSEGVFNDPIGDNIRYKTERAFLVYQSPDGGEHAFYYKLHADDPEDEGDDPNNLNGQFVLYTRDGTYLRMKLNVAIPGTSPVETALYMIEFPSGEKHYFKNFHINDVFQEAKLVRIEDQFGNWVRVSYKDDNEFAGWSGEGLTNDADAFKDNVWEITDSVGRSHLVMLEKQPGADYQSVVRKVRLDAFNNTKANYVFTYETVLVDHGGPNPPPGVGYPDRLNVPFLTSISIPTGETNPSKYSMPLSTSYYLEMLDLNEAQPVFKGAGRIKGMTLPTGGRIEWEYYVTDPADPAYGPQYFYRYSAATSARHYLRSAIGVRRRKVTEGNQTYVWKYDPKLGPVPSTCSIGSVAPNCQAIEFVNTVTTPEVNGTNNGFVTKYYFSVYPYPQDNDLGHDIGSPHISDYGLPFSKAAGRSITDNFGQPLFLSQEIFDDAGNLKRSIYVRYETDTFTRSDGFGNAVETNARMVASRTLHYQMGDDRYSEIQNYNFDGLGHFRTTEYFGNFGSGDRRIEVTRYNPDRGVYHIDVASNQQDINNPSPNLKHTYTKFPASRPWVLNTYGRKVIGDFSQRATTYFNFAQDGRLLAKRIRKDLEAASTPYLLKPRDVLVLYGYTPRGNLSSETYFGGDKKANLNDTTYDEASPSSAFPSPANNEYVINYTYPTCGGNELGVTKTKQFAGTAAMPVHFKSADYDIDCKTGLSSASRDAATNKTSYEYDKMGRLTYVKPAEGSWTRIVYNDVQNGSTSGNPGVEVFHQQNNLTTNTLDYEEYIYSQLGRLTRERSKMPDGSFSVHNTSYNKMGWIKSVSEWVGQTEQGKKTEYSAFDPFGRPWTITRPDNSVERQEFSGIRQIYRRTSVATGINSTGGLTTENGEKWERYDQFGRLFQVQERFAVGGPLVTTNYTYNVLDKLATVCTSDGAAGQCRSFGYDGQGNLRGEGQPERAWAQYDEYDTLGNVGKSHDGVHWLQYAYDRAGRFTEVSELVESVWQWRTIKKLTYSGANGGSAGNYSLGKVETSTRHNYVRNPYEIQQNVALASNGATATASSINSAGYDPKFAINGKRSGSQWGIDGGWNDGTPNNWSDDWLQIQFDGSKTINEINVFSVQDNYGSPSEPTPGQTFTAYGLVNFEVQYWNGSAWALVPGGAISNNNLVWRQVKFSPITTDRIRIVVKGALNTWSRITEVEALTAGSDTIYDLTVQESYTYSGLDGRLSKRVTTTNVPNPPTFEQTFTYDQLGQLSSQKYPECKHLPCVNSGAARPWTVNYTYTNGLMTKVGGGTGANSTNLDAYASSITYNTNQTFASVQHGNGMVDYQSIDPQNMQRPARLYASGARASWDSGPYQYDGAGNITRIGGDWFLYDRGGRLKEGSALFSASAHQKMKQRYDYDSFGNTVTVRTFNNASFTGGTLKDTYATTVNTSTNRLTLNYDAAGNVLGLPNQAPLYSYDALNMIQTAPGLTYIYGPNDERFWIVNTFQDSINSNNVETFTLRGLNNEVLREYQMAGGNNATGNWHWNRDYIYRGKNLLAAETVNNEQRHYHLDHLGSPRMVTDREGNARERMQYLPFGEREGFYAGGEAWSLYEGSTEGYPTRLGFTGHEKDSDPYGLNYMHARYYLQRGGKFLSIDPGRDVDPKQPQSWNLYSYTRNNPVNRTDPDGRFSMLFIFTSAVFQNLSTKAAGSNRCPCPTVPLAPAGADIDKNIVRARETTSEFLSGDSENNVGNALMAAHWFKSQVQNSAPWDYKQQGMQYENFGNFNYGATGSATGLFNEITLLNEAGRAQVSAKTSQPGWGKPGPSWAPEKGIPPIRR